MTIQERDKAHLWHPLTQYKRQPEHTAMVRGSGSLLWDENGNEYIDGIASWYTCMYGHCHPYIIQCVFKQMQQLDHVTFSGLTHEPAVLLSEKLMQILPENQQKIYFADNGSTAVETSIKMALQFFFNKGEKRTRIIALEEGFHGDTFGAMAVSGLSVYNGPFEELLIEVDRIPVPLHENLDEVKKQFRTLAKSGNVAAFIYEPLVQGAAAMKMHKAEHINEILKLAKEFGILTIADEIMTGFGKTGKNFASDFIEVKPDFMCLSKSLSGGMVPMGIVSCTQEVFNGFYDEEIARGFFHAHTYSANPVACSAALACIELLNSDEIKRDIARVTEAHQVFDLKIKHHPKVLKTRQCGIIYAIDITLETSRYGSHRDKLFRFFMSKGVFLRPLGNTIYILAPFVISNQQLEKVYKTIEEALEIL